MADAPTTAPAVGETGSGRQPTLKRAAPPPPDRLPGVAGSDIAAAVFVMVWLGLFGGLYIVNRGVLPGAEAGPALDAAVVLLVVVVPITLVLVLAYAARLARHARRDRARAQAAIDALRLNQIAAREASLDALRRGLEAQMADLAAAQAALTADVAALRQTAPTPEPALVPAERPRRSTASDTGPATEPTLDLETGPAADPLPPDDFIRALDFPQDERDVEGFRVLRAALEHHPTAQLVTATQDLLTLLSQDSIFMEDLAVRHTGAALWRAFADGVQGADVAALGGILDRSSLALASGRMRDDPVFRDAVHHFLRVFDRVFSTFADDATDAEIMRFADTRTARAFMLGARIAGTLG